LIASSAGDGPGLILAISRFVRRLAIERPCASRIVDFVEIPSIDQTEERRVGQSPVEFVDAAEIPDRQMTNPHSLSCQSF